MEMNFSLLVPSYNRPLYIEETIISLMANASEDVEVIVADDASPAQEQIRQILFPWIKSKKIRWIDHKKNLGWSANRNSLVHAASGKYVILLGDDDRLKPNAIQTLRSIVAKNPSVGAFGLGYDVINESGKIVHTFCPPRPIRYGLHVGDAWRQLFYYDSLPMWSHHPFTICCRRDLALKFPYDQSVDIGDDVLFLLELIANGETFLATGQNLFEWRNSFQSNGKYTNLSATKSRSTHARRLIWANLVQRTDLPEKISEVLRSKKCITRFLELNKSEVARLSEILNLNAKHAVEYLLVEPKAISEPKWYQKISRLLRAFRYLGPKHFSNWVSNRINRSNNTP